MTNSRGVAVVVGRFQVHTPHPGHMHLIDYAYARHDELLIVLGSTTLPTLRDPLPFSVRREMMLEHYPDAVVEEIVDVGNDEKWSDKLDTIIAVLCGESDVVLYHSRDSFKKHYRGQYPTHEVPELLGHSGTSVRASVATQNNADYRRGLIDGIKLVLHQLSALQGENT